MLNSRQRTAVRHLHSPLLVLAGAGSGKTRVITRKIAFLIQHGGLAPEQVVALTFTNKAAREMRERLGELLGGRPGEGLRVSTFHTLGLRLLREDGQRLGLKPNFSLLDGSDSAALLKSLLRDQPGKLDAEATRWQVSRWKSELVAAADADPGPAAAAYGRYQQMLQACNSVDFDDLIMLPVALLRDHADLRRKWQSRIRHLLVDEYQDTNSAQYELMRLLVGEGPGLTAVGDDDQSIYAWRGARPENLQRLQADFPALTVIKLEQNYRSSGRILRCANALIARNPHLIEKRLWSELGPGERLRVLPCEDAEQEAATVAAQLLDRHWRLKTPWRAFAVLYRGNHQARVFEQALRQHRIPYRISGGGSFFERAEVKDALAYLRLLVNPRDDQALLRILNVPRREIGSVALQKLAAHAQRRQLSLLSACGELGLQQSLPPRSARRLQGFHDWVHGAAEALRQGPLAQVLRRLLEEVGYPGWLRETSRDERLADRRLGNLDELLEWIARAEQGEQGRRRGAAEVLAHLSLLDSLDRMEGDAQDDAVQMSTLHAAKGLEFPQVYLVGMEEGLLPHRSALEEGNLEEERRLAYVGITRARKGLTLTYARRRRRQGKSVDCRPSRFLDELPGEELQWQGRDQSQDEAERLSSGRRHLEGLRALLENN